MGGGLAARGGVSSKPNHFLVNGTKKACEKSVTWPMFSLENADMDLAGVKVSRSGWAASLPELDNQVTGLSSDLAKNPADSGALLACCVEIFTTWCKLVVVEEPNCLEPAGLAFPPILGLFLQSLPYGFLAFRNSPYCLRTCSRSKEVWVTMSSSP